VRSGQFYEAVNNFEVGGFDGPVFLADGTARATFTARVQDDLYNRPGTYNGDCSTAEVYFNREVDPSLPGGYFKELHLVIVVTVTATIPTKASGGKVVIDDTTLAFENPSGVPC
jgi:hypothetical protein